MYELPHELFYTVWVQLPIADSGQCRAVCKTWCTWIDKYSIRQWDNEDRDIVEYVRNRAMDWDLSNKCLINWMEKRFTISEWGDYWILNDFDSSDNILKRQQLYDTFHVVQTLDSEYFDEGTFPDSLELMHWIYSTYEIKVTSDDLVDHITELGLTTAVPMITIMVKRLGEPPCINKHDAEELLIENMKCSSNDIEWFLKLFKIPLSVAQKVFYEYEYVSTQYVIAMVNVYDVSSFAYDIMSRGCALCNIMIVELVADLITTQQVRELINLTHVQDESRWYVRKWLIKKFSLPDNFFN